MTNDKARMIYYQELYLNEKREHNKEVAEKEATIKHLQGWLGIMIGANLSVTIPVIAWVVS